MVELLPHFGAYQGGKGGGVVKQLSPTQAVSKERGEKGEG